MRIFTDFITVLTGGKVMFDDSFKMRYTTIPFASCCRDHKANGRTASFLTLAPRHREMEILIARGGQARFYIDTEPYDVRGGDIVIIPPYRMHQTLFSADADFSHFCICFDLEMLRDADLRSGLESGTLTTAPVLRADSDAAAEMFRHIEQAYRIHEAQRDGWELGVTGNLCLFFSLLKEHGYILKAIPAQGADDICCRILEYIGDNYMHPITSADAAAEFHMSSSYFCRLFKRNFGCCFQNYICMYRIEKAKILLSASSQTISEISACVGFGNFSYFSRMFREFVSFTPTEYRRQTAGEK